MVAILTVQKRSVAQNQIPESNDTESKGRQLFDA